MNNNPFIKPIVLVAGVFVALFVVGKFLAPTDPQAVPAPSAEATHSADSHDAHPAEADSGKAKLGPKAVTTSTGLKYEDTVVGSGKEAKVGSSVEVHYTGWLTNGTKFDSSLDHNEPFSFALPGQVIDGWNQGIPGMKEGGKRKLVIPAALGYGEAGSPPTIPGGATLVFEVELLKVR
jgi:FKBP-type peptidyl-prolyl cis-trans isomerase FkpA